VAKIERYNPAEKTNQVTRWSTADKLEVAAAVVSTTRYLADNQSSRRLQALRNLEAYLGRPVPDLYRMYATRTTVDTAEKSLTMRVAQSVVDTAVAKIIAVQRPKPVVVTTGGSYSKRRKARKKTKFLEAQLRMPHGGFSTAWQLTQQVAKDAMLWDGGVLRVVADVGKKRPVLERCFPFDVFFDDLDAENGDPQSLFHRYRYDRQTLAAMFPDHADAIATAESFTAEGSYTGRNGDQAAVFEAYRLPISEDEPGRHVIAISSGAGNAASLLVDEEWTREGFPYVVFLWERHQVGAWGTPLIEQMTGLQSEVNSVYDFISEKVRVNSSTYIEYDPGTHDVSQLEGNDSVMLLAKKNPGGPALNFSMPQPYHPGMLDWASHVFGRCYEITGVPEMGAQGKRSPGIDSGVAIRTENALGAERFIAHSGDYEALFPQIGKRMLWAMEELAELVPKGELTTRLANGDKLEEFFWTDVTMDDYEVTLQPASSLPDSPPARLQMISEYAQNGWLDPAVAKRLMAQVAPDIESVLDREHAQYKYLEKEIAGVQDWAEQQDTDDPEDSPEMEAPEPFLDLERGIKQVREAYFELKAEDAPEAALEVLRDWMVQAQEMLSPPPS
jgi:hypothetical protein